MEKYGIPTLLLILAVCVSHASAFGLPGSKSAPVHLGGGFKIENMDAFAMTVGALVLSVIRSVESVRKTVRAHALCSVLSKSLS